MPEVQPIHTEGLEPSMPVNDRGSARSNARAKKRRARRRRVIVGGVTTVALVAVAGGAYAFTRDDGAHYRTTTVATGTVDQTISATGTVASAARDDAAFSVAGTVGKVDVAVGDTVKAGQVLASLDTSDLDDAVDSAEDTLTTAQQQLADDLDAQSGSTSSTTSSSTEGAAYVTPSSSGAASDAGTTSTVAYVTTVARATTVATSSTDTVAAAKKKVQAAQDALLAQYDTVKQALAASSDGISSSGTTCATFLAGTTSSGSTPTSSPAASASATSGTSSDDDGLADALAECQTAVKGVLADQQTVDDAQQKLLTLATDLDDAVAALQKAVAASADSGSGSGSGSSGSGSTGTPSTGSGSTGSGSSGSGSTGSGSGSGGSGSKGSGSTGSGSAGSGSAGSGASGAGSTGSGAAGSGLPSGSGTGSSGSGSRSGSDAGSGSGSSTSGATGSGSQSGSGSTGSGGQASTSKTITAEQILADQASVDLATSKVTIAEDARQRYQLTSRIAGTVAQVALAKGDSVSASSSSAVVTVVGKNGYVVDATVSLSKVSLLKTGQTADVSIVGATKKLGGTVSSIGVVNQSETSTPSYTVSITLDDASKKLYDGSSAQLQIAVAAAKDATVVPTSAVTVSGTKHTVQVLRDGKATTVAVEVGAVGDDVTQITSGLKKGDTVILADLDKDVTSGSSDSTSGLSGLGGSQDRGSQFSGGGFSGGGPGGFGGNGP
ncbi:biotin/lipoyl-binding protein [Luteimicrobium sp. DT211]|uniref:efflux RND transporter periplasmic adaptor subunit n=1 Tax=Luteimicrobium sp. DT211 TaxID=3393412 RepID=UPI003CF62BE9